MGINNFFKNLFSDKTEEEVSLRIGESVRAKKGVKNPQNAKFSVAGWQGRVVSFENKDKKDEISVGIQWDSETLRNMPEDDILYAIEHGLDYTGMFLAMNDLEKAEPRDTLQEIERVIADLNMRYRWAELGKEGSRIRKVLENTNERDVWACFEAWQSYLLQKLSFPFEAQYTEADSESNIQVGEVLSILDFDEIDDLRGLIVHVKFKQKKLQVPLADLGGTDESEQSEALKDYAVWFANY